MPERILEIMFFMCLFHAKLLSMCIPRKMCINWIDTYIVLHDIDYGSLQKAVNAYKTCNVWRGPPHFISRKPRETRWTTKYLTPQSASLCLTFPRVNFGPELFVVILVISTVGLNNLGNKSNKNAFSHCHGNTVTLICSDFY